MVEKVEEVLEATPQETPPGEPEAEPDYKVLAEEREQELVGVRTQIGKLENDLKSLRGNRGREADIRDSIKALQMEVRYLGKHQELTSKALLGDTEDPDLSALQKERQGERGEAEHERGKAEYHTWLDGRRARLTAANLDDDGNPVLDLANAPEIADERERLDAGAKAMQMEPVDDALHDAVVIINRVKRERDKEAAKLALKAAQEDEAADLDTGAGAGGGGARAEGTWRAYGRGELSWNSKVQEAGKALGYL